MDVGYGDGPGRDLVCARPELDRGGCHSAGCCHSDAVVPPRPPDGAGGGGVEEEGWGLVVIWVKSSYSFSNGNCVEVWRKSRRSVATGECVEVTDQGGVMVRDSKRPRGVVLTFTAAAWLSFIREQKG